jgi:hypothetical protein
MSFHVVTVANKSDGYYEILKQSCVQNGCKLTTLGFGEKWGGFVWRLELIQKYLKSISPYDIVIIIDGFDVVMTEHIDVFIDKYNKIGKSIVIGISNLNTLSRYMCKRVFKSIKYNQKQYFICAGMYVGYAADLSTMYDLIDQYLGFKNYNDDQLLLCKFLNSSNPIIQDFVNSKIALDTKVTLFNNTARKSTLDTIFKSTGKINLEYDPTFDKLINQYGESSSFIHGPGSIDLKPYIEKLGYNNIPDVIPYSNSRISHYTKLFIAGMFWYDWIIILIILVILVIMIKKILYTKPFSRKGYKKYTH